ncbi:uncharacterized protein LOC113518555 [Galleria mellonella]|uniref:Mitochondrial cardiolipin hydrolase n=1 Tax=Galleria mellonella TaxID=7137 RepID=A0A6J1WUJ4_GALME|nr:uncharacterized protein LOC113518555 [Galleria mellonella]
MNWKTTLYASGSLLCGIALKVLKDNLFKHNASNCGINEVLLYGADNEERVKKIGLDNLFCIYYMIARASDSIDVCIPSLQSELIVKCFISAQQRNKPKIRITIHDNDSFCNLKSVAENGIEVKFIKSSERLEHEFILINATGPFKEAVAIIGSLDYDTSRVNCNSDATIITSELAVVKTLKREFDRVWNITNISGVTLAKN